MDKPQINDLIGWILVIAFLLFTTIKYKYFARITSESWKRWARLWRNHPIVRISMLFVTVPVLTLALRGDVVALVLGGTGTIVVICQIFWIEPWIRMLEWQIKMLERFPWLIIAMNAFFVLIGASWYLLWHFSAV